MDREIEIQLLSSQGESAIRQCESRAMNLEMKGAEMITSKKRPLLIRGLKDEQSFTRRKIEHRYLEVLKKHIEIEIPFCDWGQHGSNVLQKEKRSGWLYWLERRCKHKVIWMEWYNPFLIANPVTECSNRFKFPTPCSSSSLARFILL